MGEMTDLVLADRTGCTSAAAGHPQLCQRETNMAASALDRLSVLTVAVNISGGGSHSFLLCRFNPTEAFANTDPGAAAAEHRNTR